jgi:gas vesicle protein
MASNGTSGGGVVVAFVLGAAVGAAVALLYAPAAGDETRRKIIEKAKEGRERAEAAARDGRDFLNRQRDTIKEVVDRGRDAFDQARKESL